MGVIACPMYQRFRCFPASQKDEYRDKIIKKKLFYSLRIDYYSMY